MTYATIWKYVDNEGETRILAGHPGAYPETDDEAVADGKRVMETLSAYNIEPVVILTTTEDLDNDIYDCEEVYVGPDDDDEMFFDVSGIGRLQKEEWWPL